MFLAHYYSSKRHNIRIDHIAYRVTDRNKTAKFFINAFGYKVQKEFPINFDDGSTAQCIALEPPEKMVKEANWSIDHITFFGPQQYHIPPELFISDGSPGSIVSEWVQKRGGIGGIHHIAYQVDDVDKVVKEWKDKNYAEFSSEKPLKCPEDNLIQIFTKPIDAFGGITVEFIQRGEHGFCSANVKSLMIHSIK